MRGLNTIRRNTELLERTFEMKLPIITLSEEKRLKTFKIYDPLSTEASTRTDGIL